MTQSRNNPVEAFIDRWRDTGGKERANYQLFLTELCQEQIRAIRNPLETASDSAKIEMRPLELTKLNPKVNNARSAN